MQKNELKNIPSIDELLKNDSFCQLIDQFGRETTLKSLRLTLERFREKIQEGANFPIIGEIAEATSNKLKQWLKPSLVPVINASGIILHTNLGRAPLSENSIAAMQSISTGYSNLEYELDKGKRGKRSLHSESLLKLLTGGESAFVVNNNAGAVLLVLTALAHRKRVVIANSQLVEIGGGFRIPDVMQQSGAKITAIGTTNRVHLSDYQQALQEPTALIFVAHHSNFQIIGFTTEPNLHSIASVASQIGVPLVYDLGSGALLDTSQFGLAHEPTVQDSLNAGADVICISGDKLLGGPQAGIIIGKRNLLDKIKKHPLARALRADKLCLAALSSTLMHYLKGEAVEKIPIWQMIALHPEVIKERAEFWRESIGSGEIISGKSMVGGGSLPEETLPTFLLSLQVIHPDQFLSDLRQQNIPIIARLENDRVLLDPRTVLKHQEINMLDGLRKVLKSYSINQKSVK